jgi:hypothetical protein
MTVEARELYSSSMGPIVSGSRTPFRANADRARAERSFWRRIGEDQSGGNGTILQPVTRCAFSPMSELGHSRPMRSKSREHVCPLRPESDRCVYRKLDSAIVVM